MRENLRKYSVYKEKEKKLSVLDEYEINFKGYRKDKGCTKIFTPRNKVYAPKRIDFHPPPIVSTNIQAQALGGLDGQNNVIMSP